MFLRYLFYAFLIYLAYRLIFHFIIPVYKTTKQVKKQFQQMHGQMQDYMNQSSYAKTSEDKQTANANTQNQKEQSGDYIDFEEVK